MKTKYNTFIFLLIFFVSCKDKAQNVIGPNSGKISVSLIIDNKKINLSSYKLYCINNQDTLSFSKDRNNYLIVPNKLEKNKEYTVIFEYENNVLKFDKIIGESIIPNQNMEWLFGIDKKPFDKNLALLTDKEYNDKRIKRVYYWQFNLLEFGDGAIFVRKD